MGNISYGLDDRVILVTGGSRGLGFETAKMLLEQKAKVVICGRKQENLDSAVSELGSADSVLAVQAHIAREEDVESLFKKIVEHFGRLDVLINNVGMNIVTGALIESDQSVWQKIIDSNLTGTFLCSREAGKIMKAQKKGKIISISSIAGCRAAPAMGIYGIAKAGIEMMTKVLASELAQYNIQVNAVAPCMVKTEFSKPFWSNDDIHEHMIKSIPLGRIADPDDVAYPILFLCSDASDFITGQTLMVDGGATAV